MIGNGELSKPHFHVPCQYATSYCVYSHRACHTEVPFYRAQTQRELMMCISLRKEICYRTDLGFSQLTMFSHWTGSPRALQHSYIPFLLWLLVIPSSTSKEAATDTVIR